MDQIIDTTLEMLRTCSPSSSIATSHLSFESMGRAKSMRFQTEGASTICGFGEGKFRAYSGDDNIEDVDISMYELDAISI
jgi:hypothetical protein